MTACTTIEITDPGDGDGGNGDNGDNGNGGGGNDGVAAGTLLAVGAVAYLVSRRGGS